MNNNEKLIEEAFNKHDAPSWGDDDIARDAAIRWHMRGFNDALAVFEKARTPTDDEREAMARAVHAAIPGTGPWDEDAAERTSVVFQIGDHILAAGFRHPEELK